MVVDDGWTKEAIKGALGRLAVSSLVATTSWLGLLPARVDRPLSIVVK